MGCWRLPNGNHILHASSPVRPCIIDAGIAHIWLPGVGVAVQIGGQRPTNHDLLVSLHPAVQAEHDTIALCSPMHVSTLQPPSFASSRLASPSETLSHAPLPINTRQMVFCQLLTPKTDGPRPDDTTNTTIITNFQDLARVLLSSRPIPSPLSARAQVPECSSAMHCMSSHDARTRKSRSHLALTHQSIPNLPHGSFFGIFVSSTPRCRRFVEGPCAPPTSHACFYVLFFHPLPASLLHIPVHRSIHSQLTGAAVVGRVLQYQHAKQNQRPPICARIAAASVPIALPAARLSLIRAVPYGTCYEHRTEWRCASRGVYASQHQREAGPSPASVATKATPVSFALVSPHSRRAQKEGTAAEQAR
ncbi:hypothetical protein HDK90DRAFT_174152 [Phyllosticta capitalensis]|uniref:Uncharacterized protein n=2 Tax=Phyllosticta capitalensis TaxID=121624 RepID=A0ABR1YVD2_9PEZI